MRIYKRLIIMLCIMLISMESCISIKNSEKCTRIMEVKLEEPLIFHADLNGDGKDEKVTMINKYPKGGISSLTIKINDADGRLLFNYTLQSRDYYDYGGFYFIQKFRYNSGVYKDVYKDLIFIYAGSAPPELYILYCQPRQYTEGHKMIEDEKYDVLDTGILLEEFQG